MKIFPEFLKPTAKKSKKSAEKTSDIQLEKDHKLVCVGKNPICIKCPSFLTFVLSFLKKVNYKVVAKIHALLL